MACLFIGSIHHCLFLDGLFIHWLNPPLSVPGWLVYSLAQSTPVCSWMACSYICFTSAPANQYVVDRSLNYLFVVGHQLAVPPTTVTYTPALICQPTKRCLEGGGVYDVALMKGYFKVIRGSRRGLTFANDPHLSQYPVLTCYFLISTQGYALQ